jgi:hypothetical protein
MLFDEMRYKMNEKFTKNFHFVTFRAYSALGYNKNKERAFYF